MQFTRVSAVPFNSIGTVEATKVENCGESEVTNIPQRQNTTRNRGVGKRKNKGEAKHRSPDSNNEPMATFPLPHLSAICPPMAQEIPPSPIITKVHKEIGRSL